MVSYKFKCVEDNMEFCVMASNKKEALKKLLGKAKSHLNDKHQYMAGTTPRELMQVVKARKGICKPAK